MAEDKAGHFFTVSSLLEYTIHTHVEKEEECLAKRKRKKKKENKKLREVFLLPLAFPSKELPVAKKEGKRKKERRKERKEKETGRKRPFMTSFARSLVRLKRESIITYILIHSGMLPGQ